MKIKPCKKCKSTDIEIYDCGYSSFNCGGGKCNKCGNDCYESSLSWSPPQKTLIGIWNNAQKPTDSDKLKSERYKTSKLRKQLRDMGFIPSA